MKLRTTLLTIVALLAASSMAVAAQPAATPDQAPQAAVAPSQTAEAAEAAPATACADGAQSPVLAEPLEDVLPQSHCGSGFHVDSCAECPRFSCTCSPFRLCCYC